MPWKTVEQSGPRSWAAAMAHHNSHWLAEVYVPAKKQDFDQKVEEIIPDLSNGHLLDGIDKLTKLIDYVKLDTQLADGLKTYKKRLATLAKTEEAFYKVQEITGESTALNEVDKIVRKKLTSSVEPEIRRLKLISSAYFEFAPTLYLFLSAVFQRQPKEAVNAIMKSISADFLPEVQQAYEVFKEAEKNSSMNGLYSDFLQLMMSCARIAGNFIGNAQALEKKKQAMAAIFQVLRMPVLLDLGSENRSRFGYINDLSPGFDDDNDKELLLVPGIGKRFEPSDIGNEIQLRISYKSIKSYEFVPVNDEPRHLAKITRTRQEDRYIKDLPDKGY